MTGFKLRPPPRLADQTLLPMSIGAALIPPTPHAARMGSCVTLCEFDWQDESDDPVLPRVSVLALVRLDNYHALAARLSDHEIATAVRSWYTPSRESSRCTCRYDMGNGYYILLIEEML